jgi:rhodanese-related sulfurtransferase
MQSGREMAVGLFQDSQRAKDAINALKHAGFSDDDINLLIPAGDGGMESAGRDTKSLVAGAVLGGLGGWLAGIRALTFPTVGPFIAAGSVALGAGIGTIAGGMLGISKNEARYLGSEKRGRPTLVLVRAGSRLDEAARILREQAADDVEHVREAPTSVAMGATP